MENWHMTNVHLLYPENRIVPATKVMVWAEDAFANGEIATRPRNLKQAIALLEDAGKITVRKETNE